MPWMELFIGLLTVIIALVGAYFKFVSGSYDERIKDLEELKEKVHEHWEEDAKTYLTKKDFKSFADDIKDSLIRIEEKLERLRSND